MVLNQSWGPLLFQDLSWPIKSDSYRISVNYLNSLVQEKIVFWPNLDHRWLSIVDLLYNYFQFVGFFFYLMILLGHYWDWFCAFQKHVGTLAPAVTVDLLILFLYPLGVIAFSLC